MDASADEIDARWAEREKEWLHARLVLTGGRPLAADSCFAHLSRYRACRGHPPAFQRLSLLGLLGVIRVSANRKGCLRWQPFFLISIYKFRI
jgi:hypothetical protein